LCKFFTVTDNIHKMPSQNDFAVQLKALHQPGKPLVLANVHDAYTANLLATAPELRQHVHALATASYALAATQNLADEALTKTTNLALAASIAKTASQHGLPLSMDLQDGYDDPTETVTQAIAAGAVGANIEDADGRVPRAAYAKGEKPPEKLVLYDADENVQRIKAALKAAEAAGVPDFVINARSDALGIPESEGGGIDEVIRRGKKYLAAGATTIFIFSAGRAQDITKEEVQKAVEALDGKVALSAGRAVVGVQGAMTIKEMRQLGVARISVGPTLWRCAMKAWSAAAEKLLSA